MVRTIAAVLIAPCPPVFRRIGVVVVVAIFHPLVHVTVHVFQLPSIGGKLPDRRRLLAVPSTTAISAVGQLFPLDVVAAISGWQGVFGGSSSAGGIFPLCLAWQATVLARFLAQPLNVSPRFPPGDVNHRLR